jgi:putative ABC transport system permease protein
LVIGFLVLIGAAAAGADARTYEAAMLKTMGASRRMIAASFILRAALLGLAAGAIALVVGALGGWAVSTFVMETQYQIIWPSALLIITGGITATVLAGLGFARRALQARPARVLRARE